MPSEKRLISYIGTKRFDEYFCNPVVGSFELSLATYKFDISLRGLLISALGILEVGLVAQLFENGFQGNLDSFGQARKALASLDTSARETISRNLGAKNYKELRGALQNLNYLRNRVAHHERIWNHRNPFAFPDFGSRQYSVQNSPGQNRRLLAWSLVGIQSILIVFPNLIHFEKQFENLLSSSEVDRHFLLASMGFEVP